MKLKDLFIVFASAILTLVSCEEDNIKEEAVKLVTAELTFSDYSSLPANSYPYNNKHFTPNNPASDFLPNWLTRNFSVIREGSQASITYNFKDYEQPVELTQLSGEALYTIAYSEYQKAWDDKVSANFFTPTVTPEQNILRILNNELNPREGDFRIISYNYSPQEPDISEDQEIEVLMEDFNRDGVLDWGVVETNVWYNKIVEGSGRQWSTIFNRSPNWPTAFSFNRTAGADSWLVTNNALDIGAINNLEFSFDFGWGFSAEDRMFNFHVLVSEEFDGFDPRNTEWTDITDQFVTLMEDNSEAKLNDPEKIPPSSSYPDQYTYTLSNPDILKGKKVYLAFRHKLLPVKTDGTTYTTAPFYYIDNIEVTKWANIAIAESIEEVYVLFTYSNGTWMRNQDIYTLQPSDYASINVPYISPINSSEYIPELLKKRFNGKEGDQKIVVYLTEEKYTYAEDYIFNNAEWKLNSPPITRKKDQYIFMEERGWILEEELK